MIKTTTAIKILPFFIIPDNIASVEIIFGLPEMQLSLRHNAGTSAQPYVDGTLLAIRKVATMMGLHRGLDTVMDF